MANQRTRAGLWPHLIFLLVCLTPSDSRFLGRFKQSRSGEGPARAGYKTHLAKSRSSICFRGKNGTQIVNFLELSLPYTLRLAVLRPFQAVAQWGGTHARRDQNSSSQIEIVDLLSRKKWDSNRKLFGTVFANFT